MGYLNNTGLSTQISEIKAYVSNQISSAINTITTTINTNIATVNGSITTTMNTLNNSIARNVPIGVVQAYSGNTVPTGWLLCDGSAINRTTYADLFDIIGITYGSGDGSTTFNLPNLIDKFIQGSNTAGTIKTAGLPNITGTLTSRGFVNSGNWAIQSGSGAFSRTSTASSDYMCTGQTTNSPVSATYTFNASNSSSVYGNSSTVQPPALTLKYIIKY